MGVALSRLAQEDPSFRVRSDEESGQTIIAGMGELHLEIIVDRMKREFNVEANVGKPQVAYRETIRKAVRQEGKFVRQSGGKGQYGHVVLEIEPQPNAARATSSRTRRSAARCRRNTCRRSTRVFAKRWRSGVRWRAIRSSTSRVTLVDGSYHEVDSNEMAFKIAGSMALQGRRSTRRSPVLLEPIMKVEVVTPEDYMGDVIGDLIAASRRDCRARTIRRPASSINAQVPLGEMFGYATSLRSMTQGRATFTMEFDHYAEAPNNIAEAVIKKS